jgi:hypothetical protein
MDAWNMENMEDDGLVLFLLSFIFLAEIRANFQTLAKLSKAKLARGDWRVSCALRESVEAFA